MTDRIRRCLWWSCVLGLAVVLGWCVHVGGMVNRSATPTDAGREAYRHPAWFPGETSVAGAGRVWE